VGQNQPIPTETTNNNIADPVLQREEGSGGNTVPGSEKLVASETEMMGDNNEEENANAFLGDTSHGNDAHPPKPPGTPPNNRTNVDNDETTMKKDGTPGVLPTGVAGQIFGALGSMFGVVSPKKLPIADPRKNVTNAMDQPVATAGPDSQEVESSVSTNSLVADLISGIQTIAADGKVELLKKLLNDLKSSTGSM